MQKSCKWGLSHLSIISRENWFSWINLQLNIRISFSIMKQFLKHVTTPLLHLPLHTKSSERKNGFPSTPSTSFYKPGIS